MTASANAIDHQRAFPWRSALIESGITALIVLMLAATMVGIHLETVLGGLAIATRFADVAVAVVLAFVGRLALVLMREGFPMPVMVGALAAVVLGIFVPPIDIVAAILQLFGAEAPAETPVLQVMLVAGGAILAIRAAWLVWRQRGTAESQQTRGRSLDAFGARVQDWTSLIGPIAVLFAVALPFLFYDRSTIDLATLVLTYIMLAWGLNIIVGLAGLLDLGYVAFYAVGAYSYALLATNFGWSFWLCLPLAGLLASTAGLILGFPVLRLRGDYFAIVTLGFGEIIRVILLNWFEFTGGPDGISGIARPSFFGIAEFDRNPPEGVTAFHDLFGLSYNGIHRVIFLYYLILLLALFVNFVSMRVRRLPIGRAWEALREDDIACQSLGINRRNIKLAAFMFSAGFGGVAGSFFATRQGFISPESFQFIESAIILAIVVLGGMGSQTGIVLAAVLMIGMPEVFRDLEQYRMLAFGALMVVIMVWRPRGLLSHRDPSVRLHPPAAKRLWPLARGRRSGAAPAEEAAAR